MKKQTFLILTSSVVTTLCIGCVGEKKTVSLEQSQTKQESEKNVSSSSNEKVVWEHEKSDLKPDPAVTWGVLDNGLRYAVRRNVEPPNRVSFFLYVGAGSLMEKEDQRGLAHFVEHMAFNGTKHYPDGDIVEQLQRKGIAFGRDANAFTGFDQTAYLLEIPDVEEETLHTGLTAMRDYADGILFKQEEIEKERGVILNEKRARDSISYRIMKKGFQFTFPESLIPQRMPIGIEEVIKKANQERFLDFYQRNYRADRMVMIAVGDIDTQKMEELIKEHFSSMEKQEHAFEEPSLGKIKSRGTLTQFHAETEAPNTSVSISCVQPIEEYVDTFTAREKSFLEWLVTYMMNTRLNKLAKKEGAPFTTGSFSIQDLWCFAQLGTISLTCKPEDWKQALHVAEQELRKALQYGFTRSELEEAKSNLRKNFEDLAKSAETRQSNQIARSIAAYVNAKWVFTGPEEDLKILRQLMDLMGRFTAKRAHETLKKVWSPKDRRIFVSGNVHIDNAEETIATEFQKSQKMVVSAPKEEKRVDFAYTYFGPEGSVVSKKYHPDLEITQLQLSNNVRVNLKPTDFEKNTVRVQVRFGGGKLAIPPSQCGIDFFATQAFIQGGLEKHSFDEINRLLAGKSVSTGFVINDDSYAFVGRTTPKDLLTQLQLICAYMIAPGYRQEAERQYEKMLPMIYKQLGHTAQGVVSTQVERFMHGGDKRFGLPDQEIAEQHNFEGLKQLLAEPLQSAWMEVSLVGDFDVDEVIPLCQTTVGALPERSAEKPSYEKERIVEFPKIEQEKWFSYETEVPQAISIVSWATADQSDIEKSRRLRVLSSVLDDRIRVKVREEMGDAYTPSAYSNVSDVYKDYGFITAVSPGDPQRVKEVVNAIVDTADSLATEGVSQDEFERVLNPIVKSLENVRRNNQYWLNLVVGSSQEHPYRLDWTRSMEKTYQSMTREELNALAKEYLRKERAVKVFVVPKENQ